MPHNIGFRAAYTHAIHALYTCTQPLGYHHCRTVVSGWQKSEKMRSLLSDSVGEEEREKKRRQHLLEKFEVSPLSLMLAIY